MIIIIMIIIIMINMNYNKNKKIINNWQKERLDGRIRPGREGNHQN